MDACTARRLLLVRALDSHPGATWTVEDGHWATRQARQAAPSNTAAALAARTRLALQRLGTRDAGLRQRADAMGPGLPAWAVGGLLVGLAAGLATDALAGGARIDLLAPPIWAVVA
ncbi:MAG: hypothetical protein ACKVQR_08515 [Aquabacterium sp.]